VEPLGILPFSFWCPINASIAQGIATVIFRPCWMHIREEHYVLTTDELLKRMPKEQAIAFVQGILCRMEESLNVPDIPAAKARMEKVLEELKLS
jgi:hypothetical protein